jgi:dGTP triphosphohydrolase
MFANIKRYAMRDIKFKDMAQQTAVEWLVEQLIPKAMVTYDTTTYNAIQQAKTMEKEQRIKDYNAGYTDAQCNHVNDAENYVNEQEYLNNKL